MTKVLFDSQSWLTADPKDYIDEYLNCCDQTREDYTDEENLLEHVVEWLQEQTTYEWEDFQELASKEKGHCLVTGYFMSWMGPQEGGKVYKNLETAIGNIIMDDSHVIFSIDENGLITLDETHHDAPCKGNHYEFRILTDKGETYYNTHCNGNRKTLCEALLEKGRSRGANLNSFYLSAKDFVEEIQK